MKYLNSQQTESQHMARIGNDSCMQGSKTLSSQIVGTALQQASLALEQI